ncbi:DUF1194 domain-containing protein [Roseobacter sp.]|uniref:DUF1194 domain-containing protein n=1 Tax=Roseobacter sp. TaxID=1907202 RepID=UPI00329A49C7
MRAGFISAVFLGGPAIADCRLALVLALDVSSSVDAAEDLLQRGGLAAALMSDDVRDAVFATDDHVALAIYEWSGRHNQKLLLDWRIIDTPAALFGAASVIRHSTRSHNDFPTAMGYALGYGVGVFRRGPQCHNRTLDMAGDGKNNEGFGPAQAYAAFPFDDVTVNGLVVHVADDPAQTGLIAYYRSQVLHGPGAFLEIAQGFEDYERAMRRKLVRELTPPVIGSLTPQQGTQG